MITPPIETAADIAVLIFSSLGIVIMLGIAFFAIKAYKRFSSVLDKVQSVLYVADKVFSSREQFTQAFKFVSATLGYRNKHSREADDEERRGRNKPSDER